MSGTRLMVTPYPAHVELTDKQARGALYCAARSDDPMLGAAAELFAAQGDLPVTFDLTSTCPAHADCFADPEGYVLTLSPEGVCIQASAPAGALYGAITLSHIARQYGEILPCGVIADKPRWRHRGAQISYGQANVDYRDDYLRSFIRAMADIKVNTVYLYFEWRFQFPSVPAAHRAEYMSPAQARAIQDYAARYNVTVVPALNVMGHSDDLLGTQLYQEIAEYDCEKDDGRVAVSTALCATNPRTREHVAGALSDIMDAFDSEIIHVGGDEVYALGVCPLCRAKYPDGDKAQVYIDYFCWVRDLLRARGRRMGIWSDMLVGFLRDGGDKALAGAKKLLDGTVIFDWRYDGPNTEAVDMLAAAGADLILSTSTSGCGVAAAPWLGQHRYQREYFADGFRYDIRGGLVTDWIYHHGYHGAQTGPTFATGAAMMWQGVDGESACGTSLDEIVLAYAAQTYGMAAAELLVRYWRMAGDGVGDMLRDIPAGLNTGYMRRSLYLDDSPLGTFIKYCKCMTDDVLARFRDNTVRLAALWDEIEATAIPDANLPALKGAVVMYRYLAEKFGWAAELHDAYDRAAHVQYTDPDAFRALLLDAAARLRGHVSAIEEPKAFLTMLRERYGLEQGCIARMDNTRANLLTLASFIEHLAGGHRPLPNLNNMNNFLFARPLTNFWAPRSDEWYGEPAPFTRTDGDNGVQWRRAIW